MPLTSFLFYLFSFVIFASSTMVIFSKNPVHSVLFLILAFFNSSALFIVLGAEFLAGWSSNSKYAFLGALRSAAQMISYEVSIGFILISVLLCAGSLNLSAIVLAQSDVWFFIPLFPLFIAFIICAFAETNRAPFDLPEADAELVAGYNVEYSSMSFGLFFLGEYSNMILMSAMASILFLGGWLPPFDLPYFTMIPGAVWFLLKISFFLFLFIWVRATFPRFRYDQLMRIGWKILLPLSLIWLILIASLVTYTDLLPLGKV